MRANLAPAVDSIDRLPVPVPSAPLRLVAGLELTTEAAVALDVRPEQLIARWLESKSPTARRSYARALARFAAFAIAGDAQPQDAMRLLCNLDAGPAHELVGSFRDHLLGEGLSTGTVAGAVTALGSLVRCCRRAGLCAYTLENVAPRYEPAQDRSGPTRATMERLIGFLDDRAAAGDSRALRDRAIVRLAYCCGFRRSEVAGLRLEDLDLDAGIVRPLRKGHRARQAVEVSESTVPALRDWLAVRGPAPGYVFLRLDRAAGDNAAETPVTGESVRRLLRSWARRAGLRAMIRPHGCRHAGASEIARRGSLDELMSYGGWSTMSSASRYLDKRGEQRRRALALLDM